MAEEAAVFEDASVAAIGYGYGLAGVSGGVLEGDVVGLEACPVDLDGLGEESAACGLGIERIGDDDFAGSLAEADERDVVVVLGDDDALVIRAGNDLDEHAAGCAVGIRRGEGMVVERVDDGGEGGEVLVAGRGGTGGGIHADVNVGCRGRGRDGEGQKGWKEEVSHRDESTAGNAVP